MNINTLKKKPSLKRLSNDFRNLTPGKNRLLNNTQMIIPAHGKTPNKNLLNVSQSKKQITEDIISSGMNLNKDKNQDNKNLKRINSKKMLSSTIINKGVNQIKQKNSINISTTDISNNNIKKINNKIDDNIQNFIGNDTGNDIRDKKIKIYQISKNDLIESEKELNVSNLIQMESNISDDLLLYNKEDHFLSSELNKKGMNFLNKLIINSTPQIKPNLSNLESEDILDDKWDNISKFLSLKDIAHLSLINKKIGKNSILSIIDELEKEKLFFEEKIISSVKYTFY